ncbi:MAG: shikimate kinase [Clostridia bacterium]|nr:shikimate kinase [Clostridia bacterium]
MKFGLLGEKLTHSLSPQIHNELGISDYSLFQVNREDLSRFFAENEFSGINVTIPYKKDAMQFCKKIDEHAEKIGSVNTIKRETDGTLSGYNTDYYGFLFLLNSNNISVFGKKVIILGSGGACAAVKAVLSDLRAKEIVIVSRSGENNYENISRNFDAQIIVNTTPVGMYPDNLNSPLTLEGFSALEAVVDVIYNPLKTKIMLDGEKRGIKCVNGLSMLVAQAKAAEEIFLEKEIPDSEIQRVLNKLEKDSKNIVLVGMPGCGKSTVAKELGKMLSRQVLDTDKIIEEDAQMIIPQIFDKMGEDAFRELEIKAVAKAGKTLSSVIATGGGIVKRKENFASVKQNGFVVYLERDIEELFTSGRPLSKDITALKQMFSARESLYKEISDVTVKVGENPTKTAQSIIERFVK